MFRRTVCAAWVGAVVAGLVGLSVQATRLKAAAADDNGSAADEPSGGKAKPGFDRYAKAVRGAFALPRGRTYSQLSKDQQSKLDDLKTQKEPELREALEALQGGGSKDADARHKADDVRKEIRTAIDEILGSGGGSESPPSSDSKYPSSGSPAPSYPQQGYYPPYGSGYPGYNYPFYGPGWPGYYPWGYPGNPYRRPNPLVSQNPPARPSTTPPKPRPSPPAKSPGGGMRK